MGGSVSEDLGVIRGLERAPGEGNGTPLQCSCLENPRDGGAWWATIYVLSTLPNSVNFCVFQMVEGSFPMSQLFA